MSIDKIKKYVQDGNDLDPEFLNLLASDSRVGVQKIYTQIINQKKRIEQEEKRTKKLYQHERELIKRGFKYIAGIDEVGRGPLAGPVVTAAVILPEKFIMGLNDSKALSSIKREELAIEIKDNALSYSYGIVEAAEIDEINIYQATLKAMRLAVQSLKIKPEYLLVDAVTIPQLEMPQLALVGGDGKSASIAAASILAKVYRDNLLSQLDKIYPQYEFAKNKGYGTEEHIKALKKYGLSPVHRRSFKFK